MKRNIFSTILFSSLFLFACNEGVITNENVEFEQQSLKKDIQTCGNNQYPTIGSTNTWYIEWCWTYPVPRIEYTRQEVCSYWSYLVDSQAGEILREYNCNYGPGVGGDWPKKVDFSNILYYHPNWRLTWDFTWCDYYVVERKFNDGNWTIYATIQNDTGYGNTYVNVEDDVLQGTTIYYRVNTKIGNETTYGDSIQR